MVSGIFSREQGTLNRPIILFAMMLANFMAAVEATIVATAIPTIVSSLGGFSLFTWVFSAFLLTQGATIPADSSMAVFTAPAEGEGVFVVTQVCSSAQAVSISGSAIGPLAVPGGACQSFTPGLALLPSEVLTCTTTSGSPQECMVTGLFSKK